MALSKINRETSAVWCIFADDLKASEEYLEEGIQLCQQVRRRLEQEVSKERERILYGTFIVDSWITASAATFYAGSIDKHTDVINPDFDIVMKIKNSKYHLNSFLKEFHSILLNKAAQLNINRDMLKISHYQFSVQFSFTNGMDVNLNLVLADANLTVDQVLQKMRHLPNKERYYYNSSLVEAQVGFMRRQTAFANAVARLAKYWFKNMDKKGVRICDGKIIFELLGVAAALKQQATPNGTEFMNEAFEQVVNYVKNLNQLYLAFEEKEGKWCVKTFGRQGRFPFISEPTNPSNNLLSEVTPEFIRLRLCEKHGEIMRNRLNGLIHRPLEKQDVEQLFKNVYLFLL